MISLRLYLLQTASDLAASTTVGIASSSTIMSTPLPTENTSFSGFKHALLASDGSNYKTWAVEHRIYLELKGLWAPWQPNASPSPSTTATATTTSPPTAAEAQQQAIELAVANALAAITSSNTKTQCGAAILSG